jgi:hypothetical protein
VAYYSKLRLFKRRFSARGLLCWRHWRFLGGRFRVRRFPSRCYFWIRILPDFGFKAEA